MDNEKTYDMAPGNILQNMYIKSRLKKILKINSHQTLNFIELGSGNGNISKILLSFGFNGIGFDISNEACKINYQKNERYIKNGFYQILNTDYFNYEGNPVDIVISSHTLEHLTDNELKQFFNKSIAMLKNRGGRIITLVPACMKYWGIEDETVGHYRRFESEDFINISKEYNLKIIDLSGLTFPLSNMLYGVSNFLIKRKESWKKDLSKDEQTKLSSSGGAKKVMYKTNFPYWFRFLINDVTMYPFYVLQRIFRNQRNSMNIYCELQK